MFPYKMDLAFSYSATLQPPEIIGPVAEGIRVNFHVAGGQMTGPKVRGSIRAVGADWLTIRRDGVAILDVRATMETHDGALLYIAYSGMSDLGEDGYQRFLDGQIGPILRLVTVPRLQCAHPAYQWVNRCQFVGVGEADLSTLCVRYDLYSII